MVKTIGLYKLKDVSKIDECVAAFKLFAESIPEIKASEIGKDILKVDGVTFDFTVMNTFENKEAFAAFREHPVHKAKSAWLMEQWADIKMVMIDLDEAVRVG